MVFLPRTIRSRVMRQTCATPAQSGARSALSDAVVSIWRVSIRPWLFSIVSARPRSAGADHTAEGGKRPEGLFDIRFQGGLVALDGEEIVPAAVDDRPTDRPLGEDRVAGDGDPLEWQRFQQFQRGGDFIRLGCHSQLANHALQTGAERRQQMRAEGLCGGAAAQSLAIDRHMARY